jgi:glutamate racemase
VHREARVERHAVRRLIEKVEAEAKVKREALRKFEERHAAVPRHNVFKWVVVARGKDGLEEGLQSVQREEYELVQRDLEKLLPRLVAHQALSLERVELAEAMKRYEEDAKGVCKEWMEYCAKQEQVSKLLKEWQEWKEREMSRVKMQHAGKKARRRLCELKGDEEECCDLLHLYMKG